VGLAIISWQSAEAATKDAKKNAAKEQSTSAYTVPLWPGILGLIASPSNQADVTY
jgi:hypothetical protein